MGRPSEQLTLDLKAFDWSEEAALRLLDEHGTIQTTNLESSFFTDAWSSTGHQQRSATKTLTLPSRAGTYLLQGFERNPVYDSQNTKVDLSWATVPWPDPQPGDRPSAAYAMPLVFIVNDDAPRDNFKSLIKTLRTGSTPYQVNNSTLVIAGSETGDDKIGLEDLGSQYRLRINNSDYDIPRNFTDIFVDAGRGTNWVDMRAAAERVAIVSGDGDDILLGGRSNDVLVGGAGRDWIEGGPGDDYVFGGDGQDVLVSHVSARRSADPQGYSTRDHLFGEGDIDQLFSRPRDEVYGGTFVDGSVRDEFHGQQGENGGGFKNWQASEIPFGLAGNLVLVGDDAANVITVGPPQTGGFRLITMDNQTLGGVFIRGLLGAFRNDPAGLSPSGFTQFSRLVILPGPGGDEVDAHNSPIPVYVDAGTGNDTVIGSSGPDSIVGGSGDDFLDGREHDDIIKGKAGRDTIHGGTENDTLYGYSDQGDDATPDDLFTEAGTDRYRRGPGDVIRADENDLEIGTTAQRWPVLLACVCDLADLNVAAPIRDPEGILSREPLQITQFTVSPGTVFWGEGAVFTVRAATQGWARLTVAWDQNDNGTYDAAGDVIVGRFRARAQDWRAQIGTADFAPGTVRVFARLESYDGSVTAWVPATFQVQDQVAALMPATITVTPNTFLSLLPHRNGDVTVPGNMLAGRGQIDVWEITPRTGGGFRFWTEGTTDTIVALYNASGQRIGGPDDDSGPGNNGELVVTLNGDTTYLFAVASKDGGAYDLKVTGANQTVTATIGTPPGAYVGTVTDSITSAQRLDFFEIIAPAGATLLDVSLQIDPSLSVWTRVADEQGKVIGFAQPGRPGLDDVLSSLPVEAGKRYYITVFGQYGTTGGFSVTADFYPDQLDLPDTITPPSWGQYEPLIVGADGDVTLTGQSISSAGQFKYYQISPSYPGTFTIQTTGTLDTQIGVYHGSGSSRLAWSDNDADGTNGLVTLQLQGGERYWVVARGAGNATGSFGVHVIGPDQFRRTIPIAGLSYEGEDVAIIAANFRQFYFTVTAPLGRTSLDVTLTTLPSNNVDGWFSILNDRGELTIVNTVGMNVTDALIGYPVEGGKTYLITTFGWAETSGSSRLKLDFNPNFSGLGEIPVATTTSGTQWTPDIAMNATGQSVMAWSGLKFSGAVADFKIFAQRFNADGQPAGGELLVNQDESVDATDPAVAMDGSGNFVVVWLVNGNVVRRRFNASGTAFGNQSSVSASGNASEVAVASQPGGDFLVVWTTSSRMLLGQRFYAAGNPAGGQMIIDGTADEKVNVAAAVDGAGRYIVTWTAIGTPLAQVYAIRYDAQGNVLPSGRNSYVHGRISGRRFMDTDGDGIQDPGEPGTPGITVFLDGNGNGTQDRGEPSTVTNADGDYLFQGIAEGVYRVVQLDGTPSAPGAVGDSFSRSDGTAMGPAWTEVFGDFRIEGGAARSLANENSLMVFQDFTGLDQAVTVDVGYGSGSRVVNASIYLAYADPNNFIRLTVQDNDSSDGQAAFYRIYFEHGQSGSLRNWARMTGGPQFLDVAPFSAARILAAYNAAARTVTIGIDRDFDGVYETLLTRGGMLPDGLGTQVGLGGYNNVVLDNFIVDPNVAVVPPVSVLPGEEFRVAAALGPRQWESAVAADAAGGFVIAFQVNEESSNIYVQRFAADATAVGLPFRPHEYTTGAQERPAVAMKSNGEFVVSWQSNGQEGTGYEIYARHYEFAGNPAALAESRINDYTTSDQTRVRISSNGAQRFGFVWVSYGQDLSVEGIFGRFLDFATPTPQPFLRVTESSATPNDDRVEFGNVLQGSPEPVQTVRIMNTGTLNLTGTLTLTGLGASAYSFDGAVAFDLAPGQFRDVNILFSTATRGSYPAFLTISNNTTTDPYTVSLSGTVVPTADRFEANDSTITATDLGLLPLAPVQNLSLHSSVDQDWFGFTADRTGYVQLAATSTRTEGDLDFVVHDGNLGFVAAASTSADRESASFRMVFGQRYFLRVYANGVAANVYDVSFNHVPEVALGADPTITHGVVFNRSGQFIDADSDSWTATVNYGDGSGDQSLSLNLDKTFNLNHAYAGVGNYTILVFITDSNGAVGVGSLRVSIVPGVTLSLAGSPLSESGGTATVTATLSAAAGQDVTVSLGFSGSATIGADYTRSGTTIVVPAGSLTGSVTLNSVTDALDELDETIMVEVTGVTNGTESGTQQVTAVITDDDAAPSVTLNLTGSPLAENAGAATVTVTLSAASGLDVTVSLEFTGTAGNLADYTRSATTILIPAGATSGTVTLTAIQDALDEPDETIIVDITGVTNGSEDGVQQITATITDDNVPPTVTLSVTGSPLAESGGGVTVTATLSAISGLDVTVALGFSGIAIFGTDYTASFGSIIIPAGQTTASITVTGVDDALDESEETIIVDVIGVINGSESGTQRVTATITDNDPAPTVQFRASSQTAGEADGTVAITVQLSAVSGQAVVVPFTLGGTATGGSVDYSISASPVTIPAGSATGTITITIVDDGFNEPGETVVVTLETPTNATVSGVNVHRLTITDNDPLPTVQSVVINDGSAQRSMVTSITVTFSTVVTLPATPANAFQLVLAGGIAATINVATAIVSGKTVATLTFSGTGVLGGSLADGNYRLTILGSQVTDGLGQQLDGDNDGEQGGNRVDAFFRLFGDSDGDRDVDTLDLARFRSSFGKRTADTGFLWHFDSDNDGDVDTLDLARFRLRFGTSLAAP